MKNIYHLGILLFAFFSLQSCMVSPRPNIDFFNTKEYRSGKANFMSVNVPVFLAKPFVKHALREDNESEEVINLIRKVKKIKVLTVENGNKKMLTDFAKHLNQNNYEDWATIKHDGQNVNIQALQEGETIKKLMILVNSDKELIFVDVKGNFTPDDISNLINEANKDEVAANSKNQE